MQYISLKDASRLTPYSQEYLSLRARQGKLKAVKFADVWYTTKEWLDEYRASIVEKPFTHASPAVSPVMKRFETPVSFVMKAISLSILLFGMISAGAVAAPSFWGKTLPEATAMFVENIGKGVYTIAKYLPENAIADIGAQIIENQSVSFSDIIRVFGSKAERFLSSTRKSVVDFFSGEDAPEPIMISTIAASPRPTPSPTKTNITLIPPSSPVPAPTAIAVPLFIPSREVVVTREVT